METCTQWAGRSPQSRQYTVFIGTIGDIRVTVRGMRDPWKGGGIGRPQLKLMLSFMVANVGRPVDRDDIAAVANPQWRSLARPQNLPGGLLTMLYRWGLRPAIVRGERTITLQQHPCWISDIDLIARHYRDAQLYLGDGDRDEALDRLRLAAKHCGGIFLSNFHTQDYDLTNQQQHWEHMQRDVLHQLLRLSLALARPLLLQDGAERLRRLGEPTPEDDALLATVYDALNLPHLAAYYRRRADHAD